LGGGEIVHRFKLILSGLLASTTGAGTAAAAKDQVTLSLPLVVEAASANAAVEVSTATLFGAQAARYRSIAIPDADLKLADGTILLAAGTRLFEHRATGKAFSGPLYCRLVKPGKMAVLLCLADPDADGRFDVLWSGSAVVGRADRMAPALPHPDATREDLAFDPIRYRVEAPSPDEALQLGFTIWGSNPLLGQHHFYEALGADGVTIPMTATHRAVRLSAEPGNVAIAGATIEARKLGKKRYAVRVIKALAAGEHALVDEYQVQQQIIFVPR